MVIIKTQCKVLLTSVNRLFSFALCRKTIKLDSMFFKKIFQNKDLTFKCCIVSGQTAEQTGGERTRISNMSGR